MSSVIWEDWLSSSYKCMSLLLLISCSGSELESRELLTLRGQKGRVERWRRDACRWMRLVFRWTAANRNINVTLNVTLATCVQHFKVALHQAHLTVALKSLRSSCNSVSVCTLLSFHCCLHVCSCVWYVFIDTISVLSFFSFLLQ